MPNIKGEKSNQADWHIEYTAIQEKKKLGGIRYMHKP